MSSRYHLNRSSFPTVRPEDKCVESSHVPEVVELGHVGKHVVEVVGVGGVLAVRPLIRGLQGMNNHLFNSLRYVTYRHINVEHCILWF